MGKGARYERLFVRSLEAAGYATMRSGSSGSATTYDRPDVVAGRNSGAQVWATELKMSSATTAYAEADEVDALVRWADAFGATPVVVARFKGERTYWFVKPSDCRRTEAGTYGVPKAEREERAAYRLDEVDL